MTVAQWLMSTEVPLPRIAREVGTHIARVYDWRRGKSHPGGVHLARLILVSGNAITLKAVSGKPVPKSLANLKTA